MCKFSIQNFIMPQQYQSIVVVPPGHPTATLHRNAWCVLLLICQRSLGYYLGRKYVLLYLPVLRSTQTSAPEITPRKAVSRRCRWSIPSCPTLNDEASTTKQEISQRKGRTTKQKAKSCGEGNAKDLLVTGDGRVYDSRTCP